MKTNFLKISILNITASVVFSLLLVNFGFATTYTTIADGSYNDCAIWDNGCPNNTIQQGDTVIINHVLSSSSTMYVEGVLKVSPTGSLSTSNSINVEESGILSNDGDLICNSEFEIDGYFYQNSTSTIQYLHNDGILCNTGTINVLDRVYNHGGIIQCEGVINTCEVDMANNNGSVTVTGSSASSLEGQDVCCSAGSNPFDELDGDWYIDSANVSICIFPLIPDAGENDVSSTCNDSESFIDLNTLISTGSDLGSFTETSASGAFDPVTGILNTDNLTPGTYTFTYTVIGYNSTLDESFFEITIYPVLNTYTAITTCDSDLPVEWNGYSLDEEGDYAVTLSSTVTGCDSTVNLAFTINPAVTSITQLDACSSDLPFDWNGVAVNNGGSYSVTLSSSNGCDSIASLELTVEDLALPEIISTGPVECPRDIVELSVEDVPNAEFHWIGPMGYESEDIYNEFQLDVNNSGIYSVYYTLNSCISDVAQIQLDVQNVFEYKQFDFPNVITANDDNVNDEIEIEKFVGKCDSFTFTVRDRWGNQVYVQERGEPSFNGNSILGEKLPEGVYYYKLTHSQGAATGFIHLLK